MIAPAAVAVIRATLEDAHVAELLQRPDTTAQRVAHALEDAGWDLVTHRPENVPQRAA
ncbi:hypothetical protein [Streptomyces sp. NPDC001270]|uniref:hypothetical protein n=1 Tax=Streptomyces sp. NPDC001270 TaxID=3364554 RepID=UPI0036980450